MLWEWEKVISIMKTAIIFRNMIGQTRRSGYQSKLFDMAIKAVDNDLFLEKKGKEK